MVNKSMQEKEANYLANWYFLSSNEFIIYGICEKIISYMVVALIGCDLYDILILYLQWIGLKNFGLHFFFLQLGLRYGL